MPTSEPGVLDPLLIAQYQIYAATLQCCRELGQREEAELRPVLEAQLLIIDQRSEQLAQHARRHSGPPALRKKTGHRANVLRQKEPAIHPTAMTLALLHDDFADELRRAMRTLGSLPETADMFSLLAQMAAEHKRMSVEVKAALQPLQEERPASTRGNAARRRAEPGRASSPVGHHHHHPDQLQPGGR